MTPDEFYEFCQLNPDLYVELTAEGEVVFMSPSGGATGARNLIVAGALLQWAKQNGQGVAFDSSAGFVLPNQSVRAPDASWVRRSQLAGLTARQKERFLPLCPDFIVEIASPSDRVSDLQAKMAEYIANGAQLGWLILPESRGVIVYGPGREAETLSDIDAISGDPELPGFTLDLTAVWQPLT
jgi:Uma2 family endonuclease